MVLARKSSFNTGFTTSDVGLPPHFFLNRPARGFKGIHFLETGLAAGSIAARQRFGQLLDKELAKAFKSNLKGLGFSPISPRTGINLKVIQNVTELSKVKIGRVIGEAFAGDAALAAKQAANQRYESRKGIGRLTSTAHPNPSIGNRILSGKPLTKGNRYRNVVNSFRYTAFRSGNYAGLKVQVLGNQYTVSKLKALNFGLRTG